VYCIYMILIRVVSDGRLFNELIDVDSRLLTLPGAPDVVRPIAAFDSLLLSRHCVRCVADSLYSFLACCNRRRSSIRAMMTRRSLLSMPFLCASQYNSA